MKRFNIFVLFIFLFCGGVQNKVQAQEKPLYEIHALLLYNFIRYIEWPSSDRSGDFVIGVIGNDQVHSALSKWYKTKRKDNQTIVIKQFNGALDVTKCHVIYIANKKSNEFNIVKDIAAGQHTLIVTDKPGLGKKGSNINFKMVNGRPRFELNKSATEKASLKVSSQLEKIAILI